MRLTAASKRTVALIMLVAAGYVVWSIGLGPLWRSYASYGDSAKAAQELLTLYNDISERHKNYENALVALKLVADQEGLLWPYETHAEMIGNIYNHMQSLVKQSGDLLTIDIGKAELFNNHRVAKIRIKMEYQIHRSQLGKIIYAIEASRPIFIIEHIIVERRKENLYVRMTLACFTSGEAL